MEAMRHASTFLRFPAPPDISLPSYALVVLNQRLPRFAPVLWSHAKLRVFADGGANRVYDGMPNLFPEIDPMEVRHRYKPDIIRGDMDSIRPEVKEFYVNMGVKVEDVSYDQDTTDLHKCVNYVCDSMDELAKSNLTEAAYSSQFCILIAGALGGRFDHEAGNINVLYKFSNIRIILLSDDCLIQLLPKTHCHEIHIQSSVEGPHCGLVPIGAPSASTTTTGLQWDLTDTGMSFGGLISTSNIVREDTITVKSDTDLLWTISIKKDF
ncbi:thiamine pyrophosphokinase 1-like isoform X1 [Zingiber officinale]|uniref:thiamine pyrophosphokinase 1-like isoform X1 n=1 Tax=Zingiber officinale TaxID=94328 RepID=UPI001C4AA213|nr:thiamine pyrophosphokinase 1-like isoform X1 [Zingiber officinale]